MKKITKEEFKSRTTQRRNKIIIALNELKIDEGLIVNRDEYKGKSPFYVFVGATFAVSRDKKKFKVSTLKDGSGWAVLRIK